MLDGCRWRTAPEVAEHLFDRVPMPGDERAHAPIGLVPNPAREAERRRALSCPVAETYTLNASGDRDLERDRHRQGAVGFGSSSTRQVVVPVA